MAFRITAPTRSSKIWVPPAPMWNSKCVSIPVALNAEAFYTIANGTRTSLGSLPIPASYFSGRDIDPTGGQDNISFAGIYASHRNGSQFTATFDEFMVEIPTAPIFEAHVNFMSDQLNNDSGGVIEAPTAMKRTLGRLSVRIRLPRAMLMDGETGIPVYRSMPHIWQGAIPTELGETAWATTIIRLTTRQNWRAPLSIFKGIISAIILGAAQWAGQPRGNELVWEMEIPNGTYDVTIGLGDGGSDIDSRHSAAVEGFTVVPAFVPSPGENRSGTITVAVTDGLLTVNGIGGFNSKINYIDVVESTGTAVSGVLSFDPVTTGETLETGTGGTFSSTLSGSGATTIGLVIDDNINPSDKTATGTNDWLALPATVGIGQVDFAMDATNFSEGETRSNTIIATAQGFQPASLTADLTVTAAPIVPISAPFRMNIAGGEVVKGSDTFVAEDLAYLVERDGPSETSITSYTPNPGDTDLYFPRRFNPDFGYAFPIANGNYTVAVHMVENYFEVAGERIFDVILEGNVVVDDIDLAASFGKGVLNLATFDVEVLDGELNIDFLASVNNGIVQAIEILPVALSNETDILTFFLDDQTNAANIDSDAHTIDIEVANGTDLAALAPVITVSDGASVNPASGEITDFSVGAIPYTVTAEDLTTTQNWEVTVTEAALPNTAPSITSAATASVGENQTSAIDVEATDDNDIEGPGLQYALTGLIDDALFEIDVVTGVVVFSAAPDFESPTDTGQDNVYNIQVTVTDSQNLTAVQDIAITVTDVAETDATLVINEIMLDPTAVIDAEGEWFELYNPGLEDVDVNGWIITDNDSDSHTISNGGPLLVPALGYLVLGNNSDVGTNGGKIVNYEYNGITLANGGDEIVLVDAAANEIDRVEYDTANFPIQQGASLALNNPTDDNALGANWSAASGVFGTGDMGTPGVSNSGKANESPEISALASLEVEENQTAVVDIDVTDDADSEGSGITYSFGGGLDDVLFALDSATGDLTFLTEPDFEVPTDDGANNVYDVQVVVKDAGNLTDTQVMAITVTDIDETLTFEAHINFQDNPSSTTPPTGYLADYGKQFGNASVDPKCRYLSIRMEAFRDRPSLRCLRRGGEQLHGGRPSAT